MLRTIVAALLLVTAALSLAHAKEGRVALVVGVAKYEHAPGLANTLSDARDMATSLKRLGFDVELLLDPNRSALEAAVRRYGDRSAGGDASLFYYSGHALEVAGRNWLVPTTANLNSERDLHFEAVDLNTVLEQTDGSARVAIVVLDACRDNPFVARIAGKGRSISRGLARVETATSGILVAFSTAPGQVASDGAKRHSPFTAALLAHLETAALEIKSLFAQVTKDVVEETKGKQRPWQNSSLEGDFYLLPAPSPPPPAAAFPGQSAANLEAIFWDTIKASRDPADFAAYLTRFPNGVFVDLARNRLTALQQEAAPKPPTPAPQAAVTPVSSSMRRDALLARMTEYGVAGGERANQARDYEADPGHKALAGSLEKHTFRTARWATAQAAEIGALEGCQLQYSGKPCALIAVDDSVEPARSGPPVLRDMPRANYAGTFDPAQIPRVRPERLLQRDVVSYRSAPEPKAAAIHPQGNLFIVIGGGQFEAEESALSQCNSDPVRNGAGGPCFLYAVGNQVVLPQRSWKPLTPRRTEPSGSNK
jgi:hypothetical protein